MAEEKPSGKNTSENSSGGKKKIVALTAIGVLLICLSVGGTLLALQFFVPPAPPPETQEQALEEAEAEPSSSKQPAIYYPLKPPIIVNYQARGRQRFLQIELTLMARDDYAIDAIETHMPMIRNGLVMLLSGQVYEDLQTAEGKELLRQRALEEIQQLLQQEIDKPGIEQVLFTNFVMQ